MGAGQTRIVAGYEDLIQLPSIAFGEVGVGQVKQDL